MNRAYLLIAISVSFILSRQSHSEAPADFAATVVANHWSWFNDPPDRYKGGWTSRRFASDGTATAWVGDKLRHTGTWKAIGPRTIRLIHPSCSFILTFDETITSFDGLEDGKYRVYGKRMPPNPEQNNPPPSKPASAPPQATPVPTSHPPVASLTQATPAPSPPRPLPPPSTQTPRPSTPPPAINDPLVGRWRWKKNTITTITPYGTATNAAPGKPTYDGKWKRNGSGYEINWNNGLFIDHVSIRGGDEIWLKGKDNRFTKHGERLPK